MTESLAGADTRLSWRLTLLEVTPHCQRPSSSSGTASITRRLQSPVTCNGHRSLDNQWRFLIGHLAVLCHHVFPTEQPNWFNVLLPPVNQNFLGILMRTRWLRVMTCTDSSPRCCPPDRRVSPPPPASLGCPLAHWGTSAGHLRITVHEN